jgi:integrase/recombinase XerC
MSDDLLPSPTHPVGAHQLVQSFRERYRASTLKAYEQDLLRLRKWLGAPSVEALAEALIKRGSTKANMLVLAWRQYMIDQDLSASTINRRLAAIKALVRLANVLGIADWSLSVPGMKAKSYKDTSGPGLEVVKKMIAILDSDPNTPSKKRSQAMISLLFDLALRRSEVAGVDMKDVDLERKRLLIKGKGHDEKDEFVTLPDRAVTALKEWIEVRGDHKGPMFLNFDPAGKGDGRLSCRSINRIVGKLGARAGAKVSPHGLRHSSITTALDEVDGNVRAVQQFSRHKDVRTVMTYDDRRTDLGGQVSEIVSRKLEGKR